MACEGLLAGEVASGRLHRPHDAVGDQVVGGDEQVLLGSEQAEQVGLGDAGPLGDGLGRGAGVAAAGELGHGRGEDGRSAVRPR